MSYNKVIIMGNLTRDPEIKQAGKSSVAKFGVAVNRKWNDANGQKQEEVTFIDIEAWAKQADVIGKYFKKGSPILVEGRLKLDQWEKDGVKQSKLKVVLESFSFCGGPKNSEGGSSSVPDEDDLPPGVR